MAKKIAVIDYELCMACAACIIECPISCIELKHFEKFTWIVHAKPEVDAEKCIGCGMCAKGCPIGVIELRER